MAIKGTKLIMINMKQLSFFFIIAIALAIGCKKTDDLGDSRLFRPVIAGQLSADSNTIAAAWQRIGGAKSYELQISRDTFKTIDKSFTLDTNAIAIKELLYNQLYQLQVRAIASDTVLNSKWSYLGAIKTLTSILKNPAVDDITLNSVRVRWTTKGSPVTSVKIVKKSDNSTAAQVTLTPTDITNEYVVVGGLSSNTLYTINLYSGSDLRGYVDFTTKAPFTGSVIDLTGITGRPSVLADTIPTIASGSIVLLKRGQTYNIASSINLSKSITITSAPDLTIPQQAKIYFTSNFNFAASAVIDSIEFNDVYMYSDNYGSRYVFNTTNSATVGKIKFMNSRVEIFRGVLRLQSGTTTVNNFIVDNSIVDSISNYGVLTVGVATTKAENVSFTNSTFYKAEVIVSSVSPSTSVLVDACTFNEAPAGNSTSYYLNYNSVNVTNGITVTNCIFGIGKPTSAGATTVRDYRASASTLINTGNNYRTADHLSAGNDFPSIQTSNRTSVQLWVDPANGNFKIADNTFPGRSTSGDPRWRL